MEAFGSDGIPLMIMNRAVPIINNEIKKVLSNITNFEVFLEVDTEAHDLSIFIDDGNSRRRIELGSGMEKTLTALTVRSALSSISLLPTCRLFVIDEGFGTLDSENINHMNQLLGYLKGKFDNVPVHESVQIDGKVKKLNNHMIHLAYDNVDEFIAKQKLYSELSQKKNIFKALMSPCWTFIKLYFFKRGFMDGWHGFVIAKIYAQYTFWKYIK